VSNIHLSHSITLRQNENPAPAAISIIDTSTTATSLDSPIHSPSQTAAFRKRCKLTQLRSDVLHPNRPNVSKDELRQKLSELYKAEKDSVSVFGFRTQYGGGKSTGFALVYDSAEALKKFEPHYRKVRYGLASKIEKASRQQRTYFFVYHLLLFVSDWVRWVGIYRWNMGRAWMMESGNMFRDMSLIILHRQAEEEQRKGGPWYTEDQGQEGQEGQIDDSLLRNPFSHFASSFLWALVDALSAWCGDGYRHAIKSDGSSDYVVLFQCACHHRYDMGTFSTWRTRWKKDDDLAFVDDHSVTLYRNLLLFGAERKSTIFQMTAFHFLNWICLLSWWRFDIVICIINPSLRPLPLDPIAIHAAISKLSN